MIPGVLDEHESLQIIPADLSGTVLICIFSMLPCCAQANSNSIMP